CRARRVTLSSAFAYTLSFWCENISWLTVLVPRSPVSLEQIRVCDKVCDKGQRPKCLGSQARRLPHYFAADGGSAVRVTGHGKGSDSRLSEPASPLRNTKAVLASNKSR